MDILCGIHVLCDLGASRVPSTNYKTAVEVMYNLKLWFSV